MPGLFGGRGVELTSLTAFWSGEYRPVDEIPPLVRHALGYELFVGRVTADGEDPAVLAGDTEALIAYLRLHSSAFIAAGDVLLDSAGVFLGNNLVARVADAHWQVLDSDSPEVAQGQRLSGGAAVLAMVRAILIADDDRMTEFWGVLRRWDNHDAEIEDAERRLVLRNHLQVPSTKYQRPAGADLVGALDAVIDYLVVHYRATATETSPLPHDPTAESPTVRTVRLTPTASDAAESSLRRQGAAGG